jgi:threonine dehydrogenase-like Zn-dependent dehydrogenase
MTEGCGPDVVIVAVGAPAALRAAVEEVAFTGEVVYIDYANEPAPYETRPFVQIELDILGSRNTERKDFNAGSTFSRPGSFQQSKR